MPAGEMRPRGADDPNKVTLALKYDSRARAGVLALPSLREAMERGGVTFEPRSTWLEEAEVTTYAARRAA